MALLKKKARKRVTKQLRKLVKKHGEEVITGLVATVASAIAAKAAGDTPKVIKKHRGSTPISGTAHMARPKQLKKGKRAKSAASHPTTA